MRGTSVKERITPDISAISTGYCSWSKFYLLNRGIRSLNNCCQVSQCQLWISLLRRGLSVSQGDWREEKKEREVANGKGNERSSHRSPCAYYFIVVSKSLCGGERLDVERCLGSSEFKLEDTIAKKL